MKKNLIKFSKWTFRHNPDMVLSYYASEINKLELELADFLKGYHIVDVELMGNTLSDIKRQINLDEYTARSAHISLKYNYEELKKKVDEIEKKNNDNIEKYKYLNKLRKEYSELFNKIR